MSRTLGSVSRKELASKKILEMPTKTSLYHWVDIVNYLDDEVKECLVELKAAPSEESKASATTLPASKKLILILKFLQNLLSKSRNKFLLTSSETLLEILRLDDWNVVLQGLKTAISMVEKTYVIEDEGKGFKNKELETWLLNTAFCYNLKSKQKYHFVDILKNESLIKADLYFQFNIPKAEKEVPSLITLKLQELYKDPRPSQEIAKEICDKYQVPPDLFPALWCKVRLAKTVTTAEIKQDVAMASLLAYIAFIFGTTENSLANSFLETEPKVRLIPSVIQLLKEAVPAQVHCVAIQVLTALLSCDTNSHIGIDLFPSVVNQIGLLSPNGLFQGIIKDITSLRLVPSKPGMTVKYRVESSPELLPQETAEMSDFSMSIIMFIYSFERTIIRGQSFFMNGLINTLCNFLLLPIEGHYPYNLPLEIKAMSLLYILMQHNIGDYSATELIINRLCVELNYLKLPETELCYAARELDKNEEFLYPPKLEQRQNFCKILFKLLSSSIHLSVQRNPLLQNAITGQAQTSELQRCLNRQHRRDQQRANRRRHNQPLEPAIEADPEQEEEQKDDSIIVSRRVLESKLIDLSTEIFAITQAGTSKCHDVLSYSALTLIASVIKDIPTSIPDLISRGLIPAIVSCYVERIPIESSCLKEILHGINAIILHQDGIKVIHNRSLIRKILMTLTKEEHTKLGYVQNESYFYELSRQILNLYSQSNEELRGEIVNGIKSIYMEINMRFRPVLDDIATRMPVDLQSSKMTERLAQYEIMIKSSIKLMVFLLQLAESSDHHKMLSAINADSSMIQNILMIYKSSNLLSIFDKSLRKIYVNLSIIFRKIIPEILKNGENIGKMFYSISSHIREYYYLFDNVMKTENLSEYLSGTKLLKERKDSPYGGFHWMQQIIFALNELESECEIIKYCGLPVSESCELMNYLNEFHKLLLREINRLCQEKKNYNAIKSDVSLENHGKDNLPFRIYNHFDIPFVSDYELQLEQTYNQVRKFLLTILKVAIARRRFDISDTMHSEITVNISRIVRENMRNLVSNLIDLERAESSSLEILYKIMALDDIRIVLFHEVYSIRIIHECLKLGILGDLETLYYWAVRQYLLFEDFEVLRSGLSTLLTVLLSCFEKFLDPLLLKKSGDDSGPIELGFELYEDYIATNVIKMWRSIFFNTKYAPYKSCVQFYSITNKKGFEIIESLIKTYSDSKTIKLITNPRDSRGSIAHRSRRFGISVSEAPKSEKTPSERVISSPRSMTPPVDKIAAKEFPEEMNSILRTVLSSLLEGIYSVGKYKCKFLMIDLLENWNNSKEGKSSSLCFFYQVINELQILLSSIELSYKPQIQELTGPTIEILNLDEKEVDSNKQKETTLIQIEILVDFVHGFLNYSNNSDEMIQYLLNNEFSRFLVSLTSVVCGAMMNNESGNAFVTLLSKIFLMLTFLYEGSLHNYQMYILDSELKKIAHIKEESTDKPPHMPPPEEISLLLQSFVDLLELDKKKELVTNEIIALMLSIVYFISKDPANIPELQKREIILKMLYIKKTKLRNKLPLGLIQTILLNFCEVSEMFNNYSRKIISQILYSRSVALVDKPLRKRISALQEQSAIKIDIFLDQLQFLIQRNPRVFTKNCKPVTELRQEIKNGEIKNIIQLRRNAIIKIQNEKKSKIPEVPLNCSEMHQSPKLQAKTVLPLDSPEKTNILEYRKLLKCAIKEEKSIIPKSMYEIISSMLDRLIDIHFTSQDATAEKAEYLINEETIIDIVGEMMRVYPELMIILLTFKSNAYPKISGTTLISFLLRSVFPQKFLREIEGKQEVIVNEPWKNLIMQFLKNIIYENPNIQNKRQGIIITELRRRVILELLSILSTQLNDKKPMDLKAFSILFSSLSIIEGMLSTVNPSIQLSVYNVALITKLMHTDEHLQLIRLSSELLKSFNLNAAYVELLVPKVTKILERLSRIKSHKKKIEDQKEDSNGPAESDESEDLQSMSIDPREIAEREEEIAEGNSDSLSIYSEEYHGGDSDSEEPIPGEAMISEDFDLEISGSDNEEDVEDMGEESENVEMDDNNDSERINEIEDEPQEQMLGEEEENSDNDESENDNDIDMNEYSISSDQMSEEQLQDESGDILPSNIEIANLLRPLRSESAARNDSEEINIQLRVSSSGLNQNEEGRSSEIDSPPTIRRDLQFSSISELYERYTDEELLRQVEENIRQETIGTERNANSESNNHYLLQMRIIGDNQVPILVSSSSSQQPQLSIKNYKEKKQLLIDIVRKQLTEGGLISVMVNKDTEKALEEEKEKIEEKKEEEKKKEDIPAPASKPSQETIAQRRLEFASIMPNIQVEDSLLSEIDFDFLRALPESMRYQAVEPFIQHPQSELERSSLNDDLSLSQFLSGRELNMEGFSTFQMHPQNIAKREMEEKKKKEEQKKISEEFLQYINSCDKKLQKVLNSSIFDILDSAKCVDEKIIESIIKLLYLNIKTKMPINALICNLCYNKKQTGKILSTLLFILAHYTPYEKKKTSEISMIENQVSIISLTDTIFPPLSLYNSLESMHLTYYIIALRVLNLLLSLLKVSNVVHYFFPRKGEKFKLCSSIYKLRKELALKPEQPITELMQLGENKLFRTSVLHLDTLVQLIIGLFEKYAEYRKKKRGERKPLSVMSPELARLTFSFFFLDAQNDKACTQMTTMLFNLASEEEDERCIFGQLEKLIFGLCEELLKIWKKEIEELSLGKIPKTVLEKQDDEVNIELKFGRLFKIFSNPEEDEEEIEEFEFAFNEADSMDEASEIPVKMEEKKEDKCGPFKKGKIVSLCKQPIINQTFFILTELLSCITVNLPKIGPTASNQILFKLVPTIESMMIAYDKIFNDGKTFRSIMREIKDAKKLKEKYVFKSVISHTLYNLLEENNRTINNLIRQISIQSFLSVVKSFIVRFPYFLDFDNKRTYFRGELKKLKSHSLLRLSVNRSNVFMDSFTQLASKPAEDIMGKLRVTLKGEEAVDAGGVTREWFTILSKAMFNPDLCFFKQSAHGNTYQPDAKSIIDENHISYFHFIGRMIGKALLDGHYLDCHFTRAFYKIIVGQTLNIHDLEDYDIELYKGLEWVRDNNPECLECTFSYTFDYFGEVQTRDLIEDGRNIKVTNANKHDFIVKICKAKLYDEIKPQMESLLKGLYEIIPRRHIIIFDHREIELLISGLPDIDIFDLKRNTEYHGYTSTEEIIEWFWAVMESFSGRERAEFLQFVTGSSMVPLGGFKNLQGAVGVQRFQIHKAESSVDRLPTAHTCFNQLDLPRYPSKEVLQDRLLKAIKEGADFMGLL